MFHLSSYTGAGLTSATCFFFGKCPCRIRATWAADEGALDVHRSLQTHPLHWAQPQQMAWHCRAEWGGEWLCGWEGHYFALANVVRCFLKPIRANGCVVTGYFCSSAVVFVWDVNIDQGFSSLLASVLVAHRFLVSLFVLSFLSSAFILPILSSWPPTNRTLFCSSTMRLMFFAFPHAALCCFVLFFYRGADDPSPCITIPGDDYLNPFNFTVNPPANLHAHPPPYPPLHPTNHKSPHHLSQSSSLRGLRWKTSATRLWRSQTLGWRASGTAPPRWAPLAPTPGWLPKSSAHLRSPRVATFGGGLRRRFVQKKKKKKQHPGRRTALETEPGRESVCQPRIRKSSARAAVAIVTRHRLAHWERTDCCDETETKLDEATVDTTINIHSTLDSCAVNIWNRWILTLTWSLIGSWQVVYRWMWCWWEVTGHCLFVQACQAISGAFTVLVLVSDNPRYMKDLSISVSYQSCKDTAVKLSIKVLVISVRQYLIRPLEVFVLTLDTVAAQSIVKSRHYAFIGFLFM